MVLKMSAEVAIMLQFKAQSDEDERAGESCNSR